MRPKGSGKTPGSGRKKGSGNKDTKAIRDMIVGALSDVGGQEYLARQAEENPVAFMGLVAKVLPMQLTGPNGEEFSGKIFVEFIDGRQRENTAISKQA
jgi:hypothetical protein